MLYYNSTDLSEGIAVAKSNNSKECIVCHYWYFNHGFRFLKKLFLMDVMICWCCPLILAILLLSLLKVLIITVSLKTLTNMMQFICWKIMCLMIVDIYKVHFKGINIKNRFCDCFFDYLIKAKKVELKIF